MEAVLTMTRLDIAALEHAAGIQERLADSFLFSVVHLSAAPLAVRSAWRLGWPRGAKRRQGKPVSDTFLR